MHFETYSSITDAIAREKQISAGSRAKKLALINAENQNWEKIGGVKGILSLSHHQASR